MSQPRQILHRFFGMGLYPHQLAFMLLMPLRRFILSPQQMAARLHLQPDDRVLEVGPGSGYFSRHIAASLPRGHLVLFDLQQEMLHRAWQRALQANGAISTATQGNAIALPYPNDYFHVTFLVAVLGEVPDKRACLWELFRVLRPGGLLSITGQPGDPDRLSRTAVRAWATEAGFVQAEAFGRTKNYTLNFTKPEP